jgi:hypothetical protein
MPALIGAEFINTRHRDFPATIGIPTIKKLEAYLIDALPAV